jgi:hypothetical protein
MTSNCNKCGTAIKGSMSSEGSGKGYWIIDNVKVKVKPTYYFWCVGCDYGFYQSYSKNS